MRNGRGNTMSRVSGRATRRSTAAAAVGVALLLLAGCGRGDKPQQQKVSAREALSAAGNECSATDPHSRHVNLGFPCTSCHVTGGQFAFDNHALAGGTPVSGVLTKGTPGTSVTSCAVTCHSPFGAPPQTISWDAGPQKCVQCHTRQTLGAPGVVSSHAATSEPAACQGCHDTSKHTSGAIKLVIGDGTPSNASCTGCHSGQGQMLEARTPPVLVGWDTADWHGNRTGAGFGGTLLAPFARGHEELRCRSCHSPHSSDNAFMFEASVNGTAIPAGRIDRAGVGAEALCASCHQGERHQGCQGCHTVDRVTDGQACFFCHGHEGIVNFPPPVYPTNHGPDAVGDCKHCHQSWLSVPEYNPPVYTAPFKVSAVGTTAATVSWWTNEISTSFLEFGPGDFARVAGNGSLASSHTITLTGLTPHTRYTARARSSDALHNVTRSPVYTFSTGSVGGPPTPVLTDRTDFNSDVTPATTALVWRAVTAPTGHAVQYRAYVSSTPDFSQIVGDSGWIVNQRFDINVPCTETGSMYYWYVVARDVVDGTESGWGLDTFKVTLRVLPF
jgi:predicted CXXCH cytochrome family protein